MTDHGALPLVGIPCDLRQIGIHAMHVVGEKYINAVAHGARAMPML
ncbi:MAG: gamma-glutamyl-gamma-aminobutyrate hydrolase family protein, partial [Rhodospirillaceae bacterium]|nr:gamma-glutamyl-gamma-aminobutyrate hydrolase family protein [Rhodospirillaceae bacterium]